MQKQSFSLGIHAPGILSLLSSGVYGNDETVAPRELCQNAHDSVTKRRAFEPGFIGSVRFMLREGGKPSLVVTDEGIGMDEHDVREFLSQIGRSGTAEERERLRTDGNTQAEHLIGNFGIGFLSVFMLAQSATVRTRKLGLPAEAGLEWENSGDTLCQLTPIYKDTVGTEVELTLKPEAVHLTEEEIIAALRKFAAFLDVPIYVGDEKINAPAPWLEPYFTRKPRAVRDQAIRTFFRRRSPRLIPFDLWHFRLELPEVVEGMLYITDEYLPGAASTQGVELYVRRMFIKEGLVELLPEWTRSLVRGVITTDALKPNAARDNVHQDALFQKVRDALSQVVLERLAWLAENERETFQRIARTYGGAIKGAAYHDERFYDLVADYLAFGSNAPEGMLTLGEYAALSAPEEEELSPLFYFTDRDGGSQFYPLASHANLTILDGSGGFDEELLRRYATPWRGLTPVKLDAIDDPRLLKRLTGRELDAFLPLASALEKQLLKLGLVGASVSVRRFAPEEIPVMVFCPPREAAGHALRSNPLASGPRPRVLEELSDLFTEVAEQTQGAALQFHLNASCPLVQQLQSMQISQPSVRRVLGVLGVLALDRTERLRDTYQSLILEQQLALVEEVLRHAA